jgi:hypothetical protein
MGRDAYYCSTLCSTTTQRSSTRPQAQVSTLHYSNLLYSDLYLPCLFLPNNKISFLFYLFYFVICAGHVVPLLTALLKVMYVTSESVIRQKKQRKGAYRAVRKFSTASSTVSPSVTTPQSVPLSVTPSVPLSVPLPQSNGPSPPIAVSKNLYTVCVSVLMIVSDPAVRHCLRSATAHTQTPWLREHLLDTHIRVRKSDAHVSFVQFSPLLQYSHTHTHTHTHARIHTHTRTHIHTYSYTHFITRSSPSIQFNLF